MADSLSEKTIPKAQAGKRPEVTVLWLGFIAIIAIIATQYITPYFIDRFKLSQDIALIPPMTVALLALLTILTISGRMRRTQDFARSKLEREAALASLRDEFSYLATKTIADASTAIKWGLRALDPVRDALPTAEKHTFDHIRERNDENLEILRNLNLLSRIGQKSLTSHPLSIDLREVVSDVVRIAGRATAAKGTTLVYVPPQTPIIATTDRVLLGDLILSLYLYCLGRTRGKGDSLSIRCFTVPLEDGTPHARIVVTDSGPSVPPDEREYIFDRIIKSKLTGETTAVNLGPHTAKQLSELLDHALTATLADNQTSFTLTF